MTEYIGVLIYLFIRARLRFIILALASTMTTQRLDLEKATSYECRFDAFREARSPFDIGFYLVAILFLVFDVEVSLVLPWALRGVVTRWSGFMALWVFLIVLIVRFVYEWQKRALDWN